MTEYAKTTLLQPVYSKDNNGKIRIWRAEVGWNNDDDAGYRVHSGIFDGKSVTSTWKKSKPKNVGKVNSTTALTQAHSEAESARQDKLSKGYVRDIGSVDDVEQLPFKPMLAQTYDGELEYNRVIFAQPKLDGIRCIATAKGLFTRTGKPIVSCPHIWRDIKPIFEKDPTIIFDGELYNHNLRDNFNEITSIVRKLKPSTAEVEHAEINIDYHVYDLYTTDDKDYSQRLEELTIIVDFLASPVIKLVDTFPIQSKDDLDALYADLIEEGYEGQMIRYNDVPYENKRSKSLLKRKEFLTDEFKVVSIEEGEGNWSGHIKTFFCVKDDGTEFGAGVRGNQETLKALFETANKPDWATVRYFTPTPDGIPRFPVVVDWGYGERND